MTTDLVLHRILKAPRALVWQCWTDPAHLPHWFAPKPVVTRVVALDLRAGGRFVTAMSMDGTDFPVGEGSFLEVAPQERLVFTDILGEDFKPLAGEKLGFVAILTFRDHPDGTEYTATARHFDAETAAKHEEMGFSQGWGLATTQLEAYAQSLKG